MPGSAEASARPPAARPPPRRVAALVLPALLCELAEPTSLKRSRPPLAVVLDPAPARSSSNGAAVEVENADAIQATSVLSAVNGTARKLGVREGQTVAEGRALASRLVVRAVPTETLEQGLGRIAEIGLAFGAVVAFSAPDTVWVDVTGVAHLFGSELLLAAELLSQVREAGHRARVAIADGPVLARAFARFGELSSEGYVAVPATRTAAELARLPLRALELPAELETWFVRLGVLTVADLMALPSGSLAARLGAEAPRVLDLLAGRDAAPLVRYEPPRTLQEEVTWDEPVDGSEPLLFALRGLTARVSARLRGRGEAAQALVLSILGDSKIARFRGVECATALPFELPQPLCREPELRRILSSRLERLTLSAPSVGLRLEVTGITEAVPRQLELGQLLSGVKADSADELPIVLAELAADIGADRIGVLRLVDSHRPELSSRLAPALPAPAQKARVKKARPPRAVATMSAEGAPSHLAKVTRLLPQPLPFDAPLRVGETVVLERRIYTIESLRFEQRLEAVEWWSRAVHRDYVCVVLRGSEGVFEALVYVDRESGARYLQGLWE